MAIQDFVKAAPESVGIPSEAVERFLDRLEAYGMSMHSVLMLKDAKLLCEGYYAPFTAKDFHRMYSVSKSFTSMAVGLLIGESRLRLDSRVADFFPEYDGANLHPYLSRTTVRHLLMMADSHSDTTYHGPVDRDWIATYFNTPPSHLPGTVFSYNTASTVMLCAIVERVCGKTFLEYLKEKALLETGFSPDASCVETPCGYAWGGSGVLCTSKDLLRFAYLCMKGGNWFGKQLLPASYVAQATSKQIDNFVENSDIEHQQGYGYQFWRIRNGGGGCWGVGSQCACCLPDKDFILVVTGDNQALNPGANLEILRGLWEELYPHLEKGRSLPENAAGAAALERRLAGLKLRALQGETFSPLAERISGQTYTLSENPMGIARLCVRFDKDRGELEYENRTGKHRLAFGLCANVEQEFPETHYSGKRIGTPYGKGYRCFISAAWASEQDLLLYCQVADMYFGSIKMQLSFRGEEISLRMTKVAEWFLDEYQGWAAGHM